VTYSNFTNGALVLRVWKFDGDTEVLAKFQYMDMAEMFAQQMFDRDLERHMTKKLDFFYLVVCENECRARAFGTKEEKAVTNV
jgi:hypothetical protein